jgi:hypothetical protein
VVEEEGETDLFIHLSIHISIYLPLYLSIHPSMYLSFHEREQMRSWMGLILLLCILFIAPSSFIYIQPFGKSITVALSGVRWHLARSVNVVFLVEQQPRDIDVSAHNKSCQPVLHENSSIPGDSPPSPTHKTCLLSAVGDMK